MTMLLFHYSDEYFDKFNLTEFGSNSYTRREKQVCDIPRLFFYTNDKGHELGIPDDYCYICAVDDDAIYDIRKDLYGLKGRTTNVTELIELVSEYGFDGIIYNQRISLNVVGEVVALFALGNFRILEVKDEK